MGNRVKVLSDSTCDLTRELLEKYDVDTVPLYVTLGEETLKDDGKAVKPADMFAYVESTGKLPKTAATSVVDFMEFFRPYVEEGRPVFYMGLSSELSVTFQNAVHAAQELGGDIVVMDSKSLSTGTALLILDAAEMAKKGATLAEIQAEMEKKVPLVRASFVVDTLTYLHMGGRCSTLQMLGAAMLKFKPLLQLQEGKIVNTGKMRGSIGKALHQYVKHILEGAKVDRRRVFVTHTPMPDGVAEDVVELMRSLNLFDEVIETNAGSVISSHCGPGTLGVLFMVEEE